MFDGTPIAKRNHGKEARKALKSPHTSGRMGQARVAENWVSTVLLFFNFSHLSNFVMRMFAPFFFRGSNILELRSLGHKRGLLLILQRMVLLDANTG